MENVNQMLGYSKSVYEFLSNEFKIPTPRIKVDNEDTKSLSAQFQKFTRESVLVINSDFVYSNLKTDEQGSLECIVGLPKINTFQERFLFALLHEFGHFIQYNKYEKWYNRFQLSPLQHMFILSEQEYRATKIERNADKLAIALFNKYSDILLTKEKEYAII